MGFFEEQQHENLISTINEEIDKKLRTWNRINELEKNNRELKEDFEKTCTVVGQLINLLLDCMPLLPDNENAKSIRERAAKFGL